MKRFRLVSVAAIVLFVFGAVNLWAAEKKVVKIAFLGPISGANAEIGLSARNCFDLAIKQANASGKYKYVFEPLVLDDEGNPAVGVSAALKAVSDPQVAAVTGHYNSPVAQATIHNFHQAGVPLILWGTVAPDITNKYNYPEVTRIVPTLETQSKISADFAVSKRGYKNWAIINDTTDFGVASKDTFVKSAKALGAEILSTDGVTIGTTDFRSVLTKIKGTKNVEAIYVGAVAMEGALIRDQMMKLGMKDLIMLGNTGIGNETFNKVAGPSAEGSLCTAWTNPHETVKGKKLYDEYKAKYKETFNETNGPATYDATNIIIECINKVGPDDKKALAKEIRNIKYNGAFGDTAFDEFGQTKFGGIIIYVSQDGKWTSWDVSDYAKGTRKLPKK